MGRSVIPKPLRWGKHQPVFPRIDKKSGSVQSTSPKYQQRSTSADAKVHAHYRQQNDELVARIRHLEAIASDMRYPEPAEMDESNHQGDSPERGEGQEEATSSKAKDGAHKGVNTELFIDQDDGRERTALAGDEPLELLNRLLLQDSASEEDEPSVNASEKSSEDASETFPDDPFIVAFAIFCNLFGITRAAYTAFISITSLASANSLTKLPKSFLTLKKWAFCRLPKMRICSANIEVVTQKLPAGHPRFFEPEVKMYYFNKVEYLQRLLRNPITRQRMYFGLQQLSEDEKDLWQCRLWGESVLATSDTCVYPTHFADEEPIIPGDSVIYGNYNLPFRGVYRWGKVRQVCIDCRPQSSNLGNIVVVIQPIVLLKNLPEELQRVRLHPISVCRN